jgi:hypothetical protein
VQNLRPQTYSARTVIEVARKQVLIDWDWGSGGIWWSSASVERPPNSRGRLVQSAPGFDERTTWREIGITDDLLDKLQAWNDWGDHVLGSLRRAPKEEEVGRFWAAGHELAAEVQERIGPEYEVICGDHPRG